MIKQDAVSDLINRQAAIDAVEKELQVDGAYGYMDTKSIVDLLSDLPSAQPKPSTDIQDVLEYLDDVLHPLISPNNWNVYSELHDMVSMLPSAEPKTGGWKLHKSGALFICSACGETSLRTERYCPNCGAEMEVTE